ncbi:hypothetical protein D3C76_1450970 [compost metagenome]
MFHGRQGTNTVSELHGINGFGDIIIGTGQKSRIDIRWLAASSQKQNGEIRYGVMLPYLLRQFVSGKGGHHHIGDH